MTTFCMRSRRVAGLTTLLALLLSASVAHAAARGNPETKRLPPTANAGYFLGYPSGTYSWHGCTATATKASLRRIPQAPPLHRGTRQGAVSFTAQLGTPPYIAWQAKRGWTICGVQASVLLRHPEVDADLLAEVGYTSGRQKGSTAPDGRETIRVPIPKKAIDRAEYERYEGKTFSIVSVQDVTVYVKRAR
ncbi:MAG TPA: hypothetical protein VFS37_13615 [Conexibacter sp.]|nr:hypothetical protein [Conexibacter sp.]